MFLPGRPFEPSVVIEPDLLKWRGEPFRFELFPSKVVFGKAHKHDAKSGKRPARDKHSSLFNPCVIYEV